MLPLSLPLSLSLPLPVQCANTIHHEPTEEAGLTRKACLSSCSVYATVAISLFFPLLVVDLATKAAYEQQGIELYPNCNDTVSQECFQCMPGYGSTLMDANGQTVDLDVTVSSGPVR